MPAMRDTVVTSTTPTMPTKQNFAGARVLALESRRRDEMQALIEGFGGVASVAPSMREVPLAENPLLAAFGAALTGGQVDDLVCMTGVGTRFLLRQLEQAAPGALAALAQVKIVLRSAKALPVLREQGLSGHLVAEPHTWQQVLAYYQQAAQQTTTGLVGKRIWIGEFGDRAPEDFLLGLRQLGATVATLPLYRWALPEDTSALAAALRALVAGQFDWLLLTSGVQLWHALDFARELDLEEAVRAALAKLRIASIGPVCSEALREAGLQPALEASPHKMGVLVRAASLA
jgi:uroporphyrinogen-III synthase